MTFRTIEQESTAEAGSAKRSSSTYNTFKAAVFGFLVVFCGWRLMSSIFSTHSVSHSILWAILLLVMAFNWMLAALKVVSLIDLVGVIQINNPEFEKRMVGRYQTDSDQLAGLGFYRVFFYGETISLFSFYLIFPALMLWDLKKHGAVMRLYGGTKILFGNPVFAAKDNKAYAHPNSTCVTFHTAFRDGTILLTKTRDAKEENTQTVQVYGRNANINEMWEEHLRRIDALVAVGKSVDRQTSFQSYQEMVRKENLSSIQQMQTS